MKIFNSSDIKYISGLAQECLDEIEENIKGSGKWASGRTFSTLSSSVTSGGVNIDFSIECDDPILMEQLETGRAPGKRPPVDRIYEWSQVKGIPFASDKERRSFAFAVSKSIGDRGTLQYIDGPREDIFTDTIDKYEEEVRLYVEDVINDLADDLFEK